jgi:hypothetical protein
MGRKALPIAKYIDKIEQAIMVGASYDIAARFAGVSTATFERWRSRMDDAKPGTALAELRERLEAAQARAAVGWLVKVHKAADADYRAACWLLAHRFPKEYGGEGLTKLALTTPDGEQPWQPAVVWLPSKAPDAETWAEQVQQAFPQYGSMNGHQP